MVWQQNERQDAMKIHTRVNRSISRHAALRRASRSTVIAAVLAGAICIQACNSLSPMEKQQYENLIAQGAEPVEAKNPTVAGALNLLPGVGDIYNGEWGAFALDFLLWYLSPVWAVPQGAITAGNTNKKATIAYYTIGKGRNQGYDTSESAKAVARVSQ